MWNVAGINWLDKVNPAARDLLISSGFGPGSSDIWFNDNAMALIFGTGMAIQNPSSEPNTNWMRRQKERNDDNCNAY